MHKRIGILGGMSPESTVDYYTRITHRYTERFGDSNYPEIIIYSVRFQPYIDWPAENRWDLVGEGLAEAAVALEKAGADFLIIATNTMHIVIDEICSRIHIPVLSLLDVVGDAIRAQGLHKVGLLGTKYTMEHGFYQASLGHQGLEVIVPTAEDREYVNRVIYSELVFGTLRDESRAGYLAVIDRLAAQGAEGIILGCTEIGLLVHPEHTALPLFDTTALHADAALEMALA